MNNKTALEQFEEFGTALRNLFLIICHELKIDVIVKWLDGKLE